MTPANPAAKPTSPMFQRTIYNDLGEITGWADHEKLTVGIHRRYTFNRTPVEGCIEIIQQSGDDASEEWDDFRDMEMAASILTTATGARELAAILIQAADAADALLAQPEDGYAQHD